MHSPNNHLETLRKITDTTFRTDDNSREIRTVHCLRQVYNVSAAPCDFVEVLMCVDLNWIM